MDFFAAQAASRRRTRWLLVAYALAVAIVVAAITWVVLVTFLTLANGGPLLAPPGIWWRENLGVVFATALLVLGVIGIAALHRTSQLRGGGGAVARALGGTQVTRETQDPRRRRLLNVVEEMAIASGVPVPQVFVLEQESGINAFAAGYLPTDAAVAVTQGALERLNRAELQGVIGHEFSHVLNGDMRLNTRLAGPLFGLLVIAIAGRSLLRGLRSSRSGRKGGVIILAIFAVMALGYVGVWLGRLLQAAICRQREFLADAASVQFTRDTTGLRDALVKIARAGAPGGAGASARSVRDDSSAGSGSQLATAEGEDLAHLFIAPAYARMFATHPPLTERVRALDGRYDLKELGRAASDEPVEILDVDSIGGESLPGVASLAAQQRVAIDPAGVADNVGNPGLDAVQYAQALRIALPDDLEAALSRGSTAACVWLAVGLSADTAVRARQLALIGERVGTTAAAAVERIAARLRQLPVVQRLPMLQRALPALAALPRERRLALVDLQRELAGTDARIDVLEYLLAALAARYLADQVDPRVAPRTTIGLADTAPELGVLFGTLARLGHRDAVEARRAYEMGLAPILPRERPAYGANDASDWAGAMDRALAKLDRLAPAAKELVVEGLARTVEHDGTVTVHEMELLRAACAMLHCPLPPTFGGTRR
jgi:Zn-dependent protease with chaperone function